MVFGHMSEIAICMLFAKQTNKHTALDSIILEEALKQWH